MLMVMSRTRWKVVVEYGLEDFYRERKRRLAS